MGENVNKFDDLPAGAKVISVPQAFPEYSDLPPGAKVVVSPESASKLSFLRRFNGVPVDMPLESGELQKSYSNVQKPRFNGIPAEKSSLLRRTVGDPLVGLARGVIGLPEAAVGIADLGLGGQIEIASGLARGVTGAPQILSGVSSIIKNRGKTGYIGRSLQRIGVDFQAAKEIINAELLSPEAKKSMATVDQAEGFIDNVVAYATHPDVVAQLVAESAPSVLGGAGVARKLVSVFPKMTPAVAAAIGEGVVSAGQQAEGFRRASPDGLIGTKQAALAAGTGVMTSIISQIGGRASSKLGLEDVDILLSKGSTIEKKRGILARVIGGAITEGWEEAPQSAIEQMADNVANGRPIGENVDKSMVAGLFAGMPMGGAANIAGPFRGSTSAPTKGDVQAWADENPEMARWLAKAPDPTSRKSAEIAGLPRMNKESRTAFAEALKTVEIPAVQPPPVPIHPPPVPEAGQVSPEPEIAPQAVPEGSPVALAEKANPERFFVADEAGNVMGSPNGYATEAEAMAFMHQSPEKDAVLPPIEVTNEELDRIAGESDESIRARTTGQPDIALESALAAREDAKADLERRKKEGKYAIQEPSTAEMDVGKQPEDGKGVGEALPVTPVAEEGRPEGVAPKKTVKGKVSARKIKEENAPTPITTKVEEKAPQVEQKTPELMTPEEAGIRDMGPARYTPRSEKRKFGPQGYVNATPEQISQHKAELKEYRDHQKAVKRNTELSNSHWRAVEDAAKSGRPINATSFEWRFRSDGYPGYVRKGDRYVFKGDRAPSASPSGQMQLIPENEWGFKLAGQEGVDGGRVMREQEAAERKRAEFEGKQRDLFDNAQEIVKIKENDLVAAEALLKATLLRAKEGKADASEVKSARASVKKAKNAVAKAKKDAQKQGRAGKERKRKSTEKVDDVVGQIRENLKGRIILPKKGEYMYEESQPIPLRFRARRGAGRGMNVFQAIEAANELLGVGREINSVDDLIALLSGKLPSVADAARAEDKAMMEKAEKEAYEFMLAHMLSEDFDRPNSEFDEAVNEFPDAYNMAREEYQRRLEKAAEEFGGEDEFSPPPAPIGMGADIYSAPGKARRIGKVDPLIGSSAASEYTGTKKDYVTNEMWRRWGLDLESESTTKSDEQLIDEVNAVLGRNPNEGSDLITMMHEAPYVPTDVQRIALLYEITVREKAFNAAREKGDNAAILRADEALQDAYRAVREGSREWGRAGRAMQKMMDEDFSVMHLTAVREAQTGKKATPEQRAEIQMWVDKYNKARQEFEAALARKETELAKMKDAPVSDEKAELESKREAEIELNKLVDDVRRVEADRDAAMLELQAVKDDYTGLLDVFRRAKEGMGRNRIFTAERVAAVEKAADEALAELKEMGMQLTAGLDPQRLVLLAKVGFKYIVEGAAFTESMIRTFGESIRPHLDEIRKASVDMAKNAAMEDARAPEAKQADRQKNAAQKARRSGITVRMLFKNQVEAGVFDLDTILKNVQAIIRDGARVQGLSADPTIREIRDAFSGYGKPLMPSRDPVDVALARLRTKSQKLSQLDDAIRALEAKQRGDFDGAKRLMPKKSGKQRLASTPEERELARKVRKLMKELGFVTRTSEAQMKSAVDAAKTRMNNAIEDLERAMRTGERIQKVKAGVELDADGKALKDRLEAMREEYAEIFFDETPKRTMAERRKTAKANIGKRIEALRKQILDGERTKKTGLRSVTDLELIRMKAEESALTELLDKYLPETDPYADQKSESAKRERLSRQIQSLNDQINSKTKTVVGKKDVADSPEVSALKAMRDARKKLLDEMFPKPPLTPEQQMELAERAAERNAEFWEKRLAKAQAGEKVGKRKTSSPWSPTISEAKKRVSDAKQAIQAIEDALNPPMTEAQKELKRVYDRTEALIKKGKEKIAARDFGPKPYKRPINLSDHPDLLKKKIEWEAVKSQIKAGQAKYRYEAMDVEEKIKFVMNGIWDIARNTAGSMDLSALGRQGWIYMYTHPIQWAKSFVSVKALTAEEAQRQYEQHMELENYKNGIFDAMKIAFNKTDGTGNFTSAEDNSRLDLSRKIPVLGVGVDASNRLYATAINTMRSGFANLILENSEMFKEIRKNPRNLTAEQRQFLLDIGQGVNILTGRGELKGAEAWAKFGWAPRFVKSSFDFLSFKPIRSSKTTEAKIIFAKQYARLALTLGAIYGVAMAMGGGAEWDPRSLDWGAIRLWGNYKWNPLAVVKPQVVFLARLISGQSKIGNKVVNLSESWLPFATEEQRAEGVPFGQGMSKTIGRFLQSKAHPTVGMLLSAATGKNFIGQDATLATILTDSALPLTPRKAFESFSVTDPATAVSMTVLESLGLGVEPDYNDYRVMRYNTGDDAEFEKKLQNMDIDRIRSMFISSRPEDQAKLKPYLEAKLGALIWSATDSESPIFDKDAFFREKRKLAAGGPITGDIADMARENLAKRADETNARLLKKRAQMLREIEGLSLDEAEALVRRHVAGKGDKTIVSVGGKLTPYGKRIMAIRKIYRESNVNNF